jgi:hypothetical protein
VQEHDLPFRDRLDAIAAVEDIAGVHLEDVVAAYQKPARAARLADFAGEAIRIRGRRRRVARTAKTARVVLCFLGIRPV